MSQDLQETSQQIAREVAGDDWGVVTKTRQAELIKESFDAITRGIPSTPFAEKCLDRYRNGPPKVEAAAVVPEVNAPVAAPIRFTPESFLKDAPKGKRK